MAQLPVFASQRGPLDALIEKADAVVIGETRSGSQVGNTVALVLSVTRAIKGDVAEGDLLNVTGQVRRSSDGQLRVVLGGIWFLKRSGNAWTYLPIIQNCGALGAGCYVPLATTTSLGTLPTLPLPKTPNDEVALTLASALENGYSSRGQLFIAAEAFGMLGQRPYVTELCQALRAQSNPEAKLIALAGLLGSSEPSSALSEIADNIDLLPKLDVAADLITQSIRGIDSPDPTIVSSLGRLTSIPSLPYLESSVGAALATIHTREALPFLARLLDSKAPRAREQAVRGFSRYVDNLPIPEANDQITGKSRFPRGPAPYRTAETDRFSLSNRILLGESDAEYVQFWKLWWARMQGELDDVANPQTQR